MQQRSRCFAFLHSLFIDPSLVRYLSQIQIQIQIQIEIGAFSPSSFTSRNGLQITPASSSTSTLSMKIFDWKKRNGEYAETHNDVENTEFTLSNLVPSPGSRQSKKRKGRGISAGQGATCGFGMRGQKSRSGSGTRAGFEGGQQPLYRRLPKFVGRPTGPGHEKTLYNIIKLDELNGVEGGQVCTCEYLFVLFG
jgi:ribosomal protein L15